MAYVRKNPKEKRLSEIADFVLRNGMIPSYNTMTKQFGISRSTAYALLNELLARKVIDTRRLEYENSNLPLRTVSLGEKTHDKKESCANLSGEGGKIEGSENDSL